MRTTDLLRTKRFLPFFITQFTGAFNDNLIRRGVELLIAFKGMSGEIPAEIAIFLLLALFISPFFVCSALAGFLADTKEKDRLIRIVKGVELVIIPVAAYALVQHSLLFSFAAVFCLGVQSAFFGPVKYSLPPQHLKTHELIAANGLIEAGTNVAILLATVLAGILIGVPGGEVWISLFAIVAAIIGVGTSYLVPAAPVSGDSVIERLGTVDLMKRLYSERALWLIAIGISWFWALGAIVISLLSLIARDVLGTSEMSVTIFFTIFSLGIGFGSLLCNKLLKGNITAIWVPLAALGMAGSLFGFYLLLPSVPAELQSTSSLFLSLRGLAISVLLFLLSLTAGLFIVPLYGLLQRDTKDGERSQMVAASNILNALFMVMGSLLLALFFRIGFSVSSVVLVLALINVIAAVWTCFLLPEVLLKSLLQVIFKSFFRAKVSGLEHFENVGARALIVSNHLSFLDALMLGAFLPERATFAVNTEISRKWWMRPAMACFDMIAIDPTNPMAVRNLIERLREDRKVVIFPEGRITITGALMKVYEGPAMIADKADAPLIPIRLEGFQYTIFSRVTNIFRCKLFPQLSMTVVNPRRLKVSDEFRGRARREQLGLALHDLMTELIYETNQRGPTLLHALRRVIAKVGPKKIIATDALGGSLTIGGLLQKSFVLSRIFPEIARGQGSVGVLLPNGIPMLMLFFALQWRQRTPALLNFSHSPEQIESAAIVSGFTVLITSRKFITMAKLSPHVAKLEQQRVKIVYLEDLTAKTSRAAKVGALAEFYFCRFRTVISAFDMISASAEAPAVILFTSGSEGTPKGVVLSQQNLLHNIDQVTSMVPLLPTDKVFNALPMFHSFGLTGGTLMPIIKGVQVFLYPSPLHYRIIPEMVYNESATILFGTPTFLAGYAKKAHPYDFFTVRYVFSGAERLADTVRSIYQERFGLRIFEGYGATETSPVIAVNSPFYTKKGTVGRFLPGIEYRLEAVAGIEEGGRLFVKGPNVMKGYLRIENPGNLQALETEWYDTGDIVSVDSRGFITIQGRAKRFAKIAGEMVSLTAIEQALDSAWPEHLHCVVALADPRKGERLVLVTTSPLLTRELVSEALKERGQTELAIPRTIKFVKSLPLLGSGKIDIRQVTNVVMTEEA